MNNSILIGPYSRLEWIAMLGLKRSIAYLSTKRNKELFTEVIKNDSKKLKGYLRRVA
jgi:hypothetical protein